MFEAEKLAWSAKKQLCEQVPARWLVPDATKLAVSVSDTYEVRASVNALSNHHDLNIKAWAYDDRVAGCLEMQA